MNCRYQLENRCPEKLDRYSDFVTTAINAVSAISQKRWQDVFKALLEQAHIRRQMPNYITVVTDLLRVSGFTTMPGVTSFEALQRVRAYSGNTDDKYIIRVQYFGYCAVLPDPDGDGFLVLGILPSECDFAKMHIDACWRFVPGTDNRTGIKRKGFVIPCDTRAHRNPEVKNMNPKNHSAGDCAVRGLCAALECSWDEAVDLLAKAGRYTNPIIHSASNINNALIGLGFERHKAIRRNGRLLTGKQFCEMMTYTYHKGERIFAYVGKSHCAAVLPFRQPDGSVRYLAQDAWNSADRRVGEFWLIPPKSRRECPQPAKKKPVPLYADDDLKPGSPFIHPVFGAGEVAAVDGQTLTVQFEKCGTKKFSKEWLHRHLLQDESA